MFTLTNRQNALCLTLFAFLCWSLGSNESLAQQYKKLPPAGIEIGGKERAQLSRSVEQLTDRLNVAKAASSDPQAWSPDVEVLIRAVDLALTQNLFFKKNQTKHAAELLELAGQRLKAAVDGRRGMELLGFTPNETEPQMLVGGFVSRIDDSVQPYGLVLPAGFKPNNDQSYRLDVWLHGRGDTKTEVPFLTERLTKLGQYAPKNTIVLHPFGRHCNAFKFAGETDVYESIKHVSDQLPVDSRRVAIRGFSMGGAGCWHLAAHNPTNWFAANPGAGFIDTVDYQGWTEKKPYDFSVERTKLLNLYDVLPWVANFSNTKMIGYSGEVDKQRKAAERAHAASKSAGVDWPHVIGAKMGHKIDDPSKEIIGKQLDEWGAEASASDRPRRKIDFTTFTTRYSKAAWISITGLQRHWAPANVKASIDSKGRVRVATSNGVTHFALDFSESGWKGGESIDLVLNQTLSTIMDQDPKRPGFQGHFVKDGDWAIDSNPKSLRKRPGIQGPIDDAFCDRFLFVLPSRPAAHGVVQRWIDRELAYAKSRWSRLMRGEIRVVNDRDLTDEQIENCNLICFGDFSSNRFLSRVRADLPIVWTKDEIRVGKEKFKPTVNVPVFCYPNPLNPDRYIVANSGMTFREFSNVSNSRQIAMLPDWAVLKVDGAEDGIFAGKVMAEGFFDEQWQLKP